MAGAKEPVLDEIQWRSPPIAQSMGGIHTNTVLPYFSHSPFFDATSNNAILTTQATYNPAMFHIIQTREAFEGRLKTMQGLEFMVALEPGPMPPQKPGASFEDTGVWVIRKQVRRKKQGADDELTVLSSYFIIGENIYMAPTIGSVIGSKVLSTVTSLTKFLANASSLPLFSPSTGHTYISPPPKPLTSAPTSQISQMSKENTPLPEPQGASRNIKSTSSGTSYEVQEARALEQSLNLSLQYANEYMDENPLVGEPGSFILSSSRVPPQAQAQNKAAAAVKASSPPTPQPKNLPSPTAGRKGSKGGEKSPIAAPKQPKRRKSKAAGAATATTTPK
ncbi:MAG: hypothetical protein M1819_004338 [Sarea resinae]|nr:MAG: hypothetical protein M1819_004338 [Sarea resinae]